jgi:hypothetical protein
MNLIHAFSKRYELQKSRANDGDFCDTFCMTSPRLSSIESVVFQPIDNYTQKFLMTVHRSIPTHGPEREIMGVARSLIYRVVGPLDPHNGLAARSRFAFAS